MGGWLGIAWLTAGAPAAAEPAPTCLDEIAIAGDPAGVEALRRGLAGGLLAGSRTPGCDGATVGIERADDRWHVRLARSGRIVEHDSSDPEAIASWVESWLVPNPAPPPAAPAPARDRETPPRRPPLALPPERPTPDPARPGVPLYLALRGSVDLDDVAPVWPGGELAAQVLLGPHAWLGLGATAAITPEEDDVVRKAYRMSARAGWSNPLGWGVLRLGAGLGIVAASARRELDGDQVASDAEEGPFLELLTNVDFALTEHLSISVAALGRAHLPDFDDFTETGDAGDEPGDVEGEPEPLPVFAATLQVGLGWDLGGGR